MTIREWLCLAYLLLGVIVILCVRYHERAGQLSLTDIVLSIVFAAVWPLVACISILLLLEEITIFRRRK